MSRLIKLKTWIKNSPSSFRAFRTRVKEKAKQENKNVVLIAVPEALKALKKPFLYFLVFCLAALIITPVFTYLYFVRDLSSKEKNS